MNTRNSTHSKKTLLIIYEFFNHLNSALLDIRDFFLLLSEKLRWSNFLIKIQ